MGEGQEQGESGEGLVLQLLLALELLAQPADLLSGHAGGMPETRTTGRMKINILNDADYQLILIS